MNVLPSPNLRTIWPDKPPAPPFHWRLANFGPMKIEMLFDTNGRQVFRGSQAVMGKTIPNKRWNIGGAA